MPNVRENSGLFSSLLLLQEGSPTCIILYRKWVRNFWWKYDYTPLRNYLSKFVDFPINTSLEREQPRLILTSIDIEDFTSPVVFDSYEKLHQPYQTKETYGR